ncbi:MAG: hypothetical protein PHH16_05020, partial [Candidatus Gracilibacteria bacterium]|nr:hypothetical protein [Candidatus Gracilibacteria bacterium]
MSQKISNTTMKAIAFGIVCTSLVGQSYADYTFTAGGKTGNIDSAGRVYDSNGVYSGNYNPSTGIYTNNNGGTINVNNTPGVTIYSNNVEVPKAPTPAPAPVTSTATPMT